jgi:hypothetical protein
MSSLALKVAPKVQTGLAMLSTQLLLKVIGAAALYGLKQSEGIPPKS